MTKAEKFIQDYTNHCSNELEGGGYHEWLTPEKARRAVEIARDEMLKEFEKERDERIKKVIKQVLSESTTEKDECYSNNRVTQQEVFAWLEKQGEKKPAWSEEDENYKDALIGLINEIKSQPLKRLEDWDSYLNWLKSLKDRYTWKPSDEQMKGIECAIKTLRHQLNVGDKRLNLLYDNLKKLKE